MLLFSTALLLFMFMIFIYEYEDVVTYTYVLRYNVLIKHLNLNAYYLSFSMICTRIIDIF